MRPAHPGGPRRRPSAPRPAGAAVAAAIALLGAACGDEPAGPEPGEAGGGGEEPAGVATAGAPLTVPLDPQGERGQSGAAALTPLGARRTRVVVRLDQPRGHPQPLHIHEGSCAALDPVPAYALAPLRDGRSSTVVAVGLERLRREPHAVNAHVSRSDFDAYAACGTIPRP